MLSEIDIYKVPKEVLEMSREQIREEMKKAVDEMNSKPRRKEKGELKQDIEIKW